MTVCRTVQPLLGAERYAFHEADKRDYQNQRPHWAWVKACRTSRLFCSSRVDMKASFPILFLFVVGCAVAGIRPLELHLADYNAAPGRKAIEPQPGEALLYMEEHSVLDDRDVLSVRMETDRFGEPAMELCFTPKGKERFQKASTENVGRRLVFLVQGKLVMAPQIESEASQQCVTVEGYVTAEDAAVLSKVIRR
jgi:hypothetical protein